MVVKESGFNEKEDRLEVVLTGEIDIYSADELKDKLQQIAKEHPDKDMFIDAQNLQYIDSTGLGVLIGILKILKANGKNIIISKPKDNVKKVLEITNLNRIFNVIL